MTIGNLLNFTLQMMTILLFLYGLFAILSLYIY